MSGTLALLIVAGCHLSVFIHNAASQWKTTSSLRYPVWPEPFLNRLNNYHAGIWGGEFLVSSLFWYTEHIQIGPEPTRPTQYRSALSCVLVSRYGPLIYFSTVMVLGIVWRKCQ